MVILNGLRGRDPTYMTIAPEWGGDCELLTTMYCLWKYVLIKGGWEGTKILIFVLTSYAYDPKTTVGTEQNLLIDLKGASCNLE